jgi:hypothetical protein
VIMMSSASFIKRSNSVWRCCSVYAFEDLPSSLPP